MPRLKICCAELPPKVAMLRWAIGEAAKILCDDSRHYQPDDGLFQKAA